jgi:tetratricopeptide (TPR) repeat protein
MKTINNARALVTIFLLATAQFLFGNDGKYEQAMKTNIDIVYKAQTIEELQTGTNALERIAAAEPQKWEPNYYAAFGYIMIGNREKDPAKKDQHFDRALSFIEKAKAIVPAESEVIALEGFVHMLRITIDPGTRGPKYAPMAMQTFGKAISINPENPRALALLAQMQYGSAQFFGGSTTEACGTLTKALEKFDTFKAENLLAPTWGRGMAEGLKTQCK